MPERRGLLEVARDRIRTRHMAYRTEQAYLQWMRRFSSTVGAIRVKWGRVTLRLS
jgi:hypothetical protein